MNDINIGAVCAAIIAGLISLLGLIIGKEQKISEFRQLWIDELRKCIISYLVHINTISDSIRSNAANYESLAENYKKLNEAHHGILFRINPKEEPSKNLIAAMRNFENLAEKNSTLTPESIKLAENIFSTAAQDLLKCEWGRVKRGESTYVVARWMTFAATLSMVILWVGLLAIRPPKIAEPATLDARERSGERHLMVDLKCSEPRGGQTLPNTAPKTPRSRLPPG